MGSMTCKRGSTRAGTSCRMTRQGRLAILFTLWTPLAAGWAIGCAGTRSQLQSVNPPVLQIHKISGTISPASEGSGATVTLSGANTGTTAADSSGNYVFTALAAGTYVVSASKTGFSFSPSTQSVTISTADVTGADFSAAGLQARSAVLSWTASTTPVAGYDIYRSTTQGGPYVLLNSALISGVSYTDTTVQTGQTYFYVTTAVDSSGMQSVYSDQVQAAIP